MQDLSPITEEVKESLRLIEDLKFFLATAPANWQENQIIRRYYLNHDEGFVSCIFWNNLYFITGTDIVRCIVYKFQHFGRKIVDRKKFEEGIFLDLRNLKCGTDAVLELPRSDFLEFLYKNACLRTQKKQKVFFWFNVPHDKLMADALERDYKKEKLGQAPTTVADREPALSFHYDERSSLYTQLADHMDMQKQINDPGLAHEDARSPEYTTSAKEEPAVDAPPEASDYEDDFPLDYFNNDLAYDPNDFIALDLGHQHGSYAANFDDYEAFVDPAVFSNMAGPSHLVFNDEYLIEQTQPLKTPLPLPSSAPKSAKYAPGSVLRSASDDFFPPAPYYSQPPLSAKYPPRNYYGDAIPVQGQGPYHENYLHDFPQQQGMYEIPVSQPYVLVDQPDLVQGYHYMDPMMSQQYLYPEPSARQQEISSNMMKKKRQMQQQQRLRTPPRGAVSKPTPIFKRKPAYNLDDVISNRGTSRIVTFKDGSRSVELDEVTTPETSVTNSDHMKAYR